VGARVRGAVEPRGGEGTKRGTPSPGEQVQPLTERGSKGHSMCDLRPCFCRPSPQTTFRRKRSSG